MTELLITCGITAYNAEQSVGRAIRSALSQTWRPLEIIVVNDCSTDNTAEILHRIAGDHKEVRVIDHDENLGVAAARNRILKKARGAFVAFFDDDDESHPERLARQLRRILDYEKKYSKGAHVVCYTARSQIYPDGRIVYSPTLGQQSDRPAPSGRDMVAFILTGKRLSGEHGTCPTCSQMSRLDTYLALGCFDPDFRRSEDTEFNVRLGLKGGHFVGIAEPLVTQTMTLSSEKSFAEETQYALQLLDKFRDYFETARQYEFCRLWVLRKYDLLRERTWATLSNFGMLIVQYPVMTVQRLLGARSNVTYNRSLLQLHKFDKTIS